MCEPWVNGTCWILRFRSEFSYVSVLVFKFFLAVCRYNKLTLIPPILYLFPWCAFFYHWSDNFPTSRIISMPVPMQRIVIFFSFSFVDVHHIAFRKFLCTLITPLIFSFVLLMFHFIASYFVCVYMGFVHCWMSYDDLQYLTI